jgi:hypothetical protein
MFGGLEPADDLGAAAGLAEGPLEEVGVPDAVVVLSGEPQVAVRPSWSASRHFIAAG